MEMSCRNVRTAGGLRDKAARPRPSVGTVHTQSVFTAVGATNPSLPLAAWPVAGSVTEVSPGQFQFTAPQPMNTLACYHRLRWP